MDRLIVKLRMYVLRAKVNIEKFPTNLVFIDNSDSLFSSNNIAFNLDDNHKIILSNEVSTTNNDTLIFKEYLINNGIALIYNNTFEELIPQHVNFTEINGLNFKKGCYLGQEIVARMHYLGKSKRIMYNFKITTLIEIGQKVLSPKLNNQEIGIIVDVIALDNSINYGLVSIQPDCIEDAFMDIENTQQLTITPINYNTN